MVSCMTRSTDKLLSEIETFIEKHKMSPTAFGEASMGDRHLVRRLKGGGSVTLDTADRLRVYMAEYRAPRPKRRAEGNAVAA